MTIDANPPTAAGKDLALSPPSPLLLTILAFAVGALVANLYYAQPLLGLIGPDLGVPGPLLGVVVSLTQVGYGVGLFFLVSLADLVENKRLVLTGVAVLTLALLAAALAPSTALFLLASFVIGVSATAAQVLVPFVASMVPVAQRGRAVGNVMAGLLTGILLARPAALFIAASLGWRPVFLMSAVLMLLIGALLMARMPRHQPRSGLSYPQIVGSMLGLVRDLPVLRQRAAYQCLMFGAFTLFWTAAPLMLAERFGLSQQGIALFALAGVGGAVAAPFAGRLADRGWVRGATIGAMLILALCFAGTIWAVAMPALIVLAVLAVLIDAAVQTNQVVSQRVIFALAPEVRGRVNAIYMTSAFFGGAIGSVVATVTYHWGGWSATGATGAGLGVGALLLSATERRDSSPV